MNWPEPQEFDSITEIRNRSSVRKWFINDSLLDFAASRRWLREEMHKPYDALFSIRLRSSGVLLGTLGWSDLDIENRRASFGRLTVCQKSIRKVKAEFPADYCGVALDATLTMRDYAFSIMGLRSIHTCLILGNTRAARVNQAVGLEEVGQTTLRRSNGDEVCLVQLEMTREKWQMMPRHVVNFGNAAGDSTVVKMDSF